VQQQQSPRQALVEILSGNQDRLKRHLTLELQAKLTEIARNSLQGSESPLDHLQLLKTQDGRKLDAFDYGPILFAINDAKQHQRLEAHIEADNLHGDRDEIELSLHSYRAGVEQETPLAARVAVGMRLQEGVWRLDSITLIAQLSMTNPGVLESGWWNGHLFGWDNSAENSHKADSEPQKEPPMSPMRAVRMFGLAENVYAQKHPDQGFTCGINDLINVGKGIDNGQIYKFMDPDFAHGTYNGYRFNLIGCQGKPAKSFQVTAEPLNGTGKAYCIDDRRNLRASDDGRASTCLNQGKIARR